jgi:hypothetical protein
MIYVEDQHPFSHDYMLISLSTQTRDRYVRVCVHVHWSTFCSRFFRFCFVCMLFHDRDTCTTFLDYSLPGQNVSYVYESHCLINDEIDEI